MSLHPSPIAPRSPPGVCRSCGRTRTLYRRGLCSRCYDDPAIRPLFPSPFFGGDRLNPDAETPPSAASAGADSSTVAPPGSAGKIEAMRVRVDARRPLFLRADARSDLT